MALVATVAFSLSVVVASAAPKTRDGVSGALPLGTLASKKMVRQGQPGASDGQTGQTGQMQGAGRGASVVVTRKVTSARQVIASSGPIIVTALPLTVQVSHPATSAASPAQSAAKSGAVSAPATRPSSPPSTRPSSPPSTLFSSQQQNGASNTDGQQDNNGSGAKATAAPTAPAVPSAPSAAPGAPSATATATPARQPQRWQLSRASRASPPDTSTGRPHSGRFRRVATPASTASTRRTMWRGRGSAGATGGSR